MSPSDQPPRHALPDLALGVATSEVMPRLEASARRGKLAGLRAGRAGECFRVEVGSHPFDHEIVGELSPDSRSLRLRIRLLPRLPLIYAVLIVLSVWPGLWITDSMLTTYFGWYRLGLWWTAAWYIPLTVLPLPWMLVSMLRRSRVDAGERAALLVAEIARVLDEPRAMSTSA